MQDIQVNFSANAQGYLESCTALDKNLHSSGGHSSVFSSQRPRSLEHSCLPTAILSSLSIRTVRQLDIVAPLKFLLS
jgi:hypothetical protein